jgi:hypothetical protein
MADDIVEENGQFFILKALNSPSSRFFSFTIPVGGEEFTNSFFKLLNSLDKSIKMS